MTTNHDDNLLPISDDIAQAIADGQRLVAYIVRDGSADLPETLAKAMVDARCKLGTGKWHAEDETNFLLCYGKLAKLVYPVTVESINAIIPCYSGKKASETKASRAVRWYRRYTLLALTLLLLAQLYWIIGNHLRANLDHILEQRETVQDILDKGKETPVEMKRLEVRLASHNQKLEANYQLLKVWNQISSLGVRFSAEIANDSIFFDLNKDLSQRPDAPDGVVAEEASVADDMDWQALSLSLAQDSYRGRLVYYKNTLATDFFLEAFQGYILPLLYGLLGALIYVLRSLLKEIKSLTYTHDSEIRYRLRLTLGSLSGMVVGWFFKPEGAAALASLSPMALAFLMGYNIDVLFSIMDRMVVNIKQAIEKPTADKPVQDRR